MASGTSLSVATPQVCVKTPEKDKTLQANVHCPAGRSPPEQSNLSTHLQTWRLEAVSKTLSLHGLPYPASRESAHPGQNPVREAWRREWPMSLQKSQIQQGMAWPCSSGKSARPPLDAQKPHLGFLGTDRLAEWESVDARQLFTSSDAR